MPLRHRADDFTRARRIDDAGAGVRALRPREVRMSADPLVIVSADCHIGPRLVEDLRPYCPRRLLDAFDEYVAATGRSEGRYVAESDVGDDALWQVRNQLTTGHHDPVARRRDLDFDGIAAEVVFHGSQ